MDIDLVSRTVRADAHRPWREVEARLARSGLTLGWLPPVGGGDTLASILESGAYGLRSSGYGTPADNCVAVAAVVGGLTTQTPVVPRSAAGADFRHLVFGAEGRHAPLLGVWLRVHALPEGAHGLELRFQEAPDATDSLARIIQRGACPTAGVLTVTPAFAHWELIFEGSEPITEARSRIAYRMGGGDGAEIGDGPAALERMREADRIALDGGVPDRLPWGAQLDFAAPWAQIGWAAEAVLEALPQARIAVTFPTSTGARLLVTGLDEAGRVTATAAAVAAGARPWGGRSLLHETFTGAVSSLAEPSPEAP